MLKLCRNLRCGGAAWLTKLKINLSGYDVLFGRAPVVESESAALCIRSDHGMVDSRTVTVAVTVRDRESQNEGQISETPLDFSRGVLRGGRDLNCPAALNQ